MSRATDKVEHVCYDPARKNKAKKTQEDRIEHVCYDHKTTEKQNTVKESHEHSHEHDHEHGHEHGHEHHEHEQNPGHERRTLILIFLSAALLVLAIVLDHWFNPLQSDRTFLKKGLVLVICLISYALLGWEIVFEGVKNLIRGHVMDENFLMTIASLGAFALGEYPEAVGIILLYSIGEFFEEKASAKSRQHISKVVDLRPEKVHLLIDGIVSDLAAEEVKPGHLLQVKPGERIPVDGTVIEGESRLDTSAVTGEPVPRSVKAGDAVISGCINTTAVITLRADKVLEESMVTRILRSMEEAAAIKPETDRFVTRFARIYTPIVVALALLIAATLPLLIPGWNYTVVNGDMAHSALYVALTFLVISCPCAIVLSVPLAYFCGIGAGSKNGILYKNGKVMETLTRIKVVAFDKTGTVTKGDFTVQRCEIASHGYTEAMLLGLAAGLETYSTHPIAQSICSAYDRLGRPQERVTNVKEMPGYGMYGLWQKKHVLVGNRKLMEAYGVNLKPEDGRENPGTMVMVAVDGENIGRIYIADTVRDGAKEAIDQLIKREIGTCMLSGDTEDNADRVAREIDVDVSFAGLIPEEKVQALTKLREAAGPVMFVGDGINDAPVLAGADVGAAMGSGTDAAIEAADMVYLNSDMKSIPASIRLAGKTMNTITGNIILALLVKLAVMVIGLAGMGNMWLAVGADTGLLLLCILNAIRLLRFRI